MDLADNIIKFNLFPSSHNVQLREEYLITLYCRHKGIWFYNVELVLETLCRFREKVHQGLKGSKGYPLLLPFLLSDLFEKLGYILDLEIED